MRIYEDAADFDVGFGGGGFAGVEGVWGGCWLVYIGAVGKGSERVGLTNVVWPFEFDRHILVALVVRFDTLDDGQSGEVLHKDYRSFAG